MVRQERLSLANETFVKGTITREIFYNAENGFGIYAFRVTDSSEPIAETAKTSPKSPTVSGEITLVGYTGQTWEDVTYTCYGQWETHAKYGLQFRVHHLKREMPQSREALIKYLSSDLFKGIGRKTATNIVDHLGHEEGSPLQKIVHQPDLLRTVPGLPTKKADKLVTSLQEHLEFEQVLVFLYEYGIGSALAFKIYQAYGQETFNVLQENPYQLIKDVEGVGFSRADEIGRAMGLDVQSPERMKAAIYYTLEKVAHANGHVYLPKAELRNEVAALLRWKDDKPKWESLFQTAVVELVEEDHLVQDEGAIYIPSLYYSEQGLAHKVQWLLLQEKNKYPVDDLYRVIGEIEADLEVTFAPQQREAIMAAASHPFVILTGGPGTGKTTVIQGICRLLSELEGFSLDPSHYGIDDPYPVRLAAPTGRAAQRMSETTGLPAVTIHRLLGWRGDFFEQDADYPISGKLLVVDEASMMDMWLAYQLFRSIPEGMSVILVGDADQLPSVGPGQVFHHFIESEQIPCIQLEHIFRQAEGSSIVALAHEIKQGRVPVDVSKPMTDRRFFPCDKDQVVSIVEQLVVQAVKRGYTIFDVQVLAPIYKGSAGVDRINQTLQRTLNPPDSGKKEMSWGAGVFRLGDKVLQLVNHPEEPINNGDIGEVIAVDDEGQSGNLWVRFDRTEVGYSRNQLNQLTLAYCTSIHKAQGTEFPIVILPIVRAYSRMLQRNLIYTAVTRAKSYLMLCGDRQAFEEGVRKIGGFERNSQLCARLRWE